MPSSPVSSPKGTWVRVKHPIVEGKLDVPPNAVQVGDQLRVRLTRVDPPKGFIDFARV
jgi:exoribonuclease-2